MGNGTLAEQAMGRLRLWAILSLSLSLSLSLETLGLRAFRVSSIYS